MDELAFYNNSLHHIDLSLDKIKSTEISDEGDLQDYIEDLIQGVNEAKNKRQFKFKRDTAEVANAVKEIFNNKQLDKNIQIIADRLLEEEKKSKKILNEWARILKKAACFSHFLKSMGKIFSS